MGRTGLDGNKRRENIFMKMKRIVVALCGICVGERGACECEREGGPCVCLGIGTNRGDKWILVCKRYLSQTVL